VLVPLLVPLLPKAANEPAFDFESWRRAQLQEIARVFCVPAHLIRVGPFWGGVDWASGPDVTVERAMPDSIEPSKTTGPEAEPPE
jgi:hypothetical protein